MGPENHQAANRKLWSFSFTMVLRAHNSTFRRSWAGHTNNTDIRRCIIHSYERTLRLVVQHMQNSFLSYKLQFRTRNSSPRFRQVQISQSLCIHRGYCGYSVSEKHQSTSRIESSTTLQERQQQLDRIGVARTNSFLIKRKCRDKRGLKCKNERS